MSLWPSSLRSHACDSEQGGLWQEVQLLCLGISCVKWALVYPFSLCLKGPRLIAKNLHPWKFGVLHNNLKHTFNATFQHRDFMAISREQTRIHFSHIHYQALEVCISTTEEVFPKFLPTMIEILQIGLNKNSKQIKDLKFYRVTWKC